MNYRSDVKAPLWQGAWALWHDHRELVQSLVRRDLSNRYKGSMMGLFWAILTPAVQIAIFTLIFAGIFKARFGSQRSELGFAVYLFCGMLPWIAFSEAVQRATTSLTENVNLVKRVVFPIEALPLNLVLSALVQQLIGTAILLVAALLLEGTLRLTALLLPVLLIPQLMLTLGLSWLAASLGAFLRDTPQFTQLLLMVWLYLTPIYYPEEMIPPRFQWISQFNPIAPLVRSYRRILLEGQWPDWQGLAFTLTFALVCFIFGYWWFERTKKAFADIL
jgi:lipopolysaccharide transport system permease protein